MAGPAAGRPRVRALRAGRDRRLEELRLAVLEERIDAELALGRTDLVGELEALIARPSAARAAARAADARALPLGPPGRGARGLPRDARARWSRSWASSPAGAAASSSGRSCAGPALDGSPRREAPPERPRRGGAFVGRERELAELIGRARRRAGRRGRLVLLAGEPGIGKSRLADELIGQARARGARVLVGRCWEAGGAPAYWPWVQSLRAYVRETGARRAARAARRRRGRPRPAPARAARALPRPAASRRRPSGGRALSPLRGGERLPRGAPRGPARWCSCSTTCTPPTSPRCCCCGSSPARSTDSRLLVVCAFRDVDPTMRDPLSCGARRAGARAGGPRQIALAGLSERRRRRSTSSSRPGPSPRPGSSRRSTPRRRAIRCSSRRSCACWTPKARLGDAGRRTCASRRRPCRDRPAGGAPVRAMPRPARRRLRAGPGVRARRAGAAERAFRATSCSMPSTRPWPSASSVDVPGSPGRLRFGHALIRDTLYDELTPARRLQLHREPARRSRRSTPTTSIPISPSSPTTTSRPLRPGWRDKAVDYARRAGDRAASQLAYEEAARLYEMALDARRASQPRAASCCSRSATPKPGPATPPPRSRRSGEAAELAEDRGLREQLARAALGYGGRIIWERQQDDDYLVPLLERALAALGSGDSALRVRLLSRLAGGPLRGIRFPPERRFELSERRSRWHGASTTRRRSRPRSAPMSPRTNPPRTQSRPSSCPRSCSRWRAPPATRSESSRLTSTDSSDSSSSARSVRRRPSSRRWRSWRMSFASLHSGGSWSFAAPA